MKKIKIRIISLMVAIASLINLHSINTFASSEKEKYIKIDSKNIISLLVDNALEWASMVEPNVNLNVGNINKVIVPESNEIKYAVSYFSNTIPYGYAVLSFNNDDVVVEQAIIDRGIDNIYSELIDVVDANAETSLKNYKIDKEIIQFDPFQYGIVITDKNNKTKGYNNYGEEIDINYGDEAVYKSGSSIYIRSANWKSSEYVENKTSKIVLDKFSKRSLLFTQKKVTDITGRYACAVQALTQIAYMEGLCTGTERSILTTYNLLWAYTDTKETEESQKNTDKEKTIFGTTGTLLVDGIVKSGKGFVTYAKNMGYRNTEYKGVTNKPSVAWIKDKLKYNRPVLMSYGIDINSNGKIVESGHQISILGYVSAKKVSSGNTWNYLMVYDGWNNTVSYLNYSTVDFNRCSATYFWVK